MPKFILAAVVWLFEPVPARNSDTTHAIHAAGTLLAACGPPVPTNPM